MKAMVLEAYNAELMLREVPKPVPGSGQVLVKIAASGINPLDLKIRAGLAGHAQTKLPAILGLDLAGVVESVGEGVSRFKAGDEVFGMTGGVGGVQGSLAEYAAVDEALLAMKPGRLSMREAAVIPLIFITAWEGLVDRAKVGPGMKVLIHGGAGGVGHVGIQLALARGAEVFATGRGTHADVIRSFGAIPIDSSRESVEDYMQEHTGGEGFDVVMDNLGGAILDASFQAVKRYTGHVVSALGWGTHTLAPLSFRGGTYSGVFTLYPLLSGQGRAHHGEILAAAAGLADAGKLRPLVDDRQYSLEQIEEAHHELQEHRNRGKIAVTV